MNDDPAVGPIFQKHCPRCSAWNEATVDRLPRDGTTKPTVGEIDLYIPAECPFRANRKNVANHQHPNHKHRIDRRSPKLWNNKASFQKKTSAAWARKVSGPKMFG
jgi:hypothetical protein